MTCCATPEGTERQEEDVAQDLGGLQEYRRITPMALFAPYRPQRMQASPGSAESLAGLATAPGFSSPTPPARRRTSPAGGAGRHRTGCAVRRGGCRRGFPCRAADRARRRACSSSLARPAVALAPTVEALPLMVCRVAALPWTSPSPSWRSSWAKRSCMSGTKRRNTWTISSRLPLKRPTISPRASTSSPASAAVAGAPLAPLLPR